MNDSTLAQEIENFMARSNAVKEQKEDLKAAEAAGRDRVIITDKNFNDYQEFLEQQRKEDEENGTE